MDTILVIASTLLFLSGVAVTYLLHSRYPLKIVVPERVPPLSSPAELISVIVPARNEARNIRRCVLAMLAQTYPNYEIIVVDDRSSDETPAILAALQQEYPGRLRVVSGGDLPTGWAGKPHALYLGVQPAGGDWLCFVDADTFAAPELLAAALSTAQAQKADLFTLLTDQELGSFWEKVILPLVFTALSFGFPAEQVNDPNRPEAIANGQFILIRRPVYSAVGGHAAIRDRIAEDKALAEQVKRGRLPPDRSRWAASGQHAHVHPLCRNLGRLDQEYLSRDARPAEIAAVWGLRGSGGSPAATGLAAGEHILVSFGQEQPARRWLPSRH